MAGAGITRFFPARQSQLSEAIIDAAAASNAIVAGVAIQTVRVFRIFFVVSDATTITLINGATPLTGAITMKAGGSFVLDLDAEPWFTTSAGNGFVLAQSGAAQLSGRCYYTQS
jgi:hypothetical protein